jgi:hypothetical protein
MSSLPAAQCNGVSLCGPNEPRVEVGARGNQRPDLRRRLGNLARPVGHQVQQRSGLPAAGVVDARMVQLGVLVEELLERCRVAGADHVGDPTRQRRLRPQPRRLAGELVVGFDVGLRLGREPGAGERSGAVAVVLHAHDPPVGTVTTMHACPPGTPTPQGAGR